MKSRLGLIMGSVLMGMPMATVLADVKIYGHVQAEYNVEDLDGQSAEQGVDDSVRSRIGFTAAEKLGNGMSALVGLEFNLDPTGDNGTALNNRQLFVGLKHKKWGFLGLGTFSSPYKTAGGIKLDPFYQTALQAAGAGGQSSALGGAANVNGGTNGIVGNDGFVVSAIFYKSPSWNSISISAIISPDEKNSGVKDQETTAEDGDDNDFAVAVNYRNGDFWAFAAFAENNEGGVNQEDEQAWKLGFQMTLAAHTLGFQYEWIKDSSALTGGQNVNGVSNFSSIADIAGNSTDGEVWFLGYQYKAGNNTFVAQYGETESDSVNNVDGRETEYLAVGIIHRFSPRTRIFAGYSESDSNNDGGSPDREVITAGIRKDF